MRPDRSTSLSCLLLTSVFSLVAVGCSTPQTPLHVLKDKANHEFDYHRWAKASEYYGEIVQRDPSDGDAQFHYGVSLLHQKEYAKAESALLTAHALDPTNDEVVFRLAEALHQQGDHAKLFAMLRNRAHDNRSVTTWMVVVDYSEKLDDYDSALEAVTNACAVETGDTAEPYYRAAVLLGKIGRSEDAVRRLRQAYAVEPDNEQVNMLLVEYGEIPGPTLGLAPGR